MSTVATVAKSRISVAREDAAYTRALIGEMAETTPATIDRLMLRLATTMCSTAERQLSAALDILNDVAAEPLDADRPTRKEAQP
jgi:hypothetical protein